MRTRHCWRTDWTPIGIAMPILVSMCGWSTGHAIAGPPPVPQPTVGQTIYHQQCVRCHGDAGQGNAGQGDSGGTIDPLRGDLSIDELTEIIEQTMPEDDPDLCVGAEARSVAMHIHDSFYGPAAQARRNPPRQRLARLTAEQLRQSVADLYAHFGQPAWRTDARGVSGNYFTGAGWSDDRIRIKRIDPTIDFDFGRDGPGQEVDPQFFYVHWDGSLLVPQTGTYEIVVRSSCSFQMQFGTLGPLFFDNHVQSAGKEEFRRSIELIGGRVYPLKIDLQQRKRKTEQPPVRISLAWVPPNGTEQIIPSRYLLPDPYPSTFSLQTHLAPDDRSYGYERGIAIDRAWDQSTTDAGLEFADAVISDLYPAYVKQAGGDQPPAALTRSFLIELIGTAFRGPLDDELTDQYVDQVLNAYDDNRDAAIRHAILKCFKSPRFLYPTLDQDQSLSRQRANRLALVLFDSLPAEPWLLDSIDKHELQTIDQITVAAERMVDDFRTDAKLRSFLFHWLDLADRETIHKDQQRFPDFDPQLVNDLTGSFNHFLDHVVQSEASDFRDLFQADWAPTNRRMASFYGDAWQTPHDWPLGDAAAGNPDSTGEPFVASKADPKIHVGVLTHPYLTSRFAYHRTTSPIHRGVFLSRYVLGRVIRPPAEAFTPLDEKLHPDLTTRQRIELQTGSTNCQVCHRKINGLGFALEHFDAVGRYRDSEGDRPIDASGNYQPRVGETVEFNGARELGTYLADSEDCQRAFVESAFEYFVKQPLAAYGRDASDQLLESFRENDFHIRKLIVQIAVIAADRPHFNLEPSTDDQASD